MAYYKYFNFFVANVNPGIINKFLADNIFTGGLPQVLLPLGISFYTFQGISYLIDVFKGNVTPNRNLVNFACYMTMFPQLVAGPIVRYSQLEAALTARKLTVDGFSQGARRFIWGLAKKLLIADTLARVADIAFSLPAQEVSALAAWAGMICYTLQIYYDFSGYSDMAIGLGKMFGFTFPENFNYPYIARSIQEFWRRWHMTLSLWFKDYLYIPLGGNRKGTARTCFNLLIVFTLCGFWHGAEWVFILWGLYHGFFLVLERFIPAWPQQLPGLLQHFYSMAVVAYGWVIFKSHHIGQVKEYTKALLGFYPGGIETNRLWVQLFSSDVYLALIIGIIGSAPVLKIISAKIDTFKDKNAFALAGAETLACLGLLAMLLLCLMPVFHQAYTSFIYFRF